MTLFIFLLGIAIILGIARYNESNKLFWTLLFSFVVSFAAAKIVIDSFSSKDGSNTTFEQVQPTQGLVASSGSLVYLLANEDLPAIKQDNAKPVGKALVPAAERDITSSVSGVTEGLYVNTLANPPNNVEIVDDS